MKTRRFFIVVMFLLASTAPLWADDQAASVNSLKKRAAQGDAEAQNDLGNLYLAGHGVPQDYAQAVQWYRRAAHQGLAAAQGNLGSLYGVGRGVPQDYAQAVKWLRLAADHGDAGAQLALGFMYAAGHGVAPDYVQAYKWLSLAAAALTTNPDHDNAVQARDTLAARMAPAQIAEAQKLAREWKKQ
jgi:TPR repeat protein